MSRKPPLALTRSHPTLYVQDEPRAVVMQWGDDATVCLDPKTARMVGEAIFRIACGADENGS